MQQKKYFYSLIALVMLLTQLIQPSLSYAQVVDMQEEPYEAYKVIEDVNVDETITILQGTQVYGVQNGEFITLQFKDSTIDISAKLVDLSETKSEFVKFPLEGNDIALAKGTTLFNNNIPNVTIAEETTYPSYKNESDQDVFLIGNVEFYLAPSTGDEEQAPKEEVPKDNIDSREQVKEDNLNETNTEDKQVITEEDPSETEQIKESDDKAIEKSKATTAESVNPWDGVTSDYFKVVTNDLVVYDNREGPLKPVGKLTNDEVYPRVSDYGNWHRIQFGDIYGYVKKEGTLPDDGSNLKNENKNYKNLDRMFKSNQDIVVYDNTSGSLVPFGTIDKETIYPIATDYGNWWRIIYSDRVGYVRKSEVEFQFNKSDSYFKADTNAIVYDNRGSGPLKPIGKLVKGQVYPRVSDYGNWHQIKFGDFYGYVSKKDTSIATGESLANINKNYTNHERQFIPFEDIPVYDNTSGRLVEFGTINAGQSYSVATNYSNWWRVIFSDRVGYVRKSDVQTLTIDSDEYFEALVNLPVYDNRSGSLKEVGELVEGQAYPIEANFGNWWKVNFGDIYGYVKKADTGYATKDQIPNLNKKFTHSDDEVKALQNVTVFDNTSGQLIPFGQLDEGTIFPIATDYGNWWRIIYLDRVGYIKKSEVELFGITYSHYDISIGDLATKQMPYNPQTDVYGGGIYARWDAFESINLDTKQAVLKQGWSVRTGPGQENHRLYVTTSNRKVTLFDTEAYKDRDGKTWRRITRNSLPTWINAPKQDVMYYMNPNNFVNDDIQQFQFLDLRHYTGVPVAELEGLLSGKGTLHGTGDIFARAAQNAGINEIYLVSHALLESGNGSSTLAKGIKVNGKTVYNFFGIGAYDSCPISCGAERAYQEGWFTVEDAIIGGAQFAKNDYIYSGQNTLYKMRFNPAKLMNGQAPHQYASDIGWAAKQVYYYTRFYSNGNYNLYFDIPVYNN